MKNSMGQFEVVKIDQVVEVEKFKNFYEVQTKESEEQLKNDLQSQGQLLPVVVNKNHELIDGYRRVNLLRELGIDTVRVIVVDKPTEVSIRISYNMTRIKSHMDLVNEVLYIFESTPKKQGSRSGMKYNRSEIISKKLNYKWKSNSTLIDLEKVISKDFENHVLLNGIINLGWNISDCLNYVTTLKEIDIKQEYGLTEKLSKGKLSIGEVVKFINQRELLRNEYKDTFVIPGKSTSIRMNCCDIKNEVQFHSKVNTIFTSVPYWGLRFYENEEDYNQLGHERTPEEFASKIGDIFRDLEMCLNETSNVFVNIGDTYVDGCSMDVPGLVKREILMRTNLKLKDIIIWSKPNPKPQGEKVKRLTNKIEYILWFVVEPKKSKYNLLKYTDTPKEIVLTGGAKDVDKNGNVAKKRTSLSKPYKKIYNHISQQEVENIIECTTGKNHPICNVYPEGHPAAMAELLPVIPILMTTDEHDLVYDPFGGGNTTGRIAQLLNRNYLSTELSQHYHRIGCKVLENTLQEYNQEDLDTILSEVFVEQSKIAA